ncbi:MAG TPA: signal recognition particle-docking protein FtsY [Candidatus Binataceae bacterium]|nr:signal recognition particle-docking protein FtsY [Candidatus Binataceae bacterium]
MPDYNYIIEILPRLTFIDRLALEVAASQVVVLIAAILIEFSARKRRRARPSERAPEQKPEQAEQGTRPEVALAEEVASWPTPRTPPVTPAPVRPEPVEPSSAEGPAPGTIAIPAPPPATPSKAPPRIGLGLRRTRENLLARIRAAITGSAKLDEICEGLEEALIAADVGVQASLKLVEAVRSRVKDGTRPDAIREALKDEIARMLAASERPMNVPASEPLVVMLAGVNGAGKTTTVAKLAARMKAERGTVIVAAADTFRAAAIEQLEVWCGRVGVDLIRQNQGSDPAAVAFDAIKAAVARDVSTVLIDTAGRLQTKVNLMEELKKIARVAGRELPGAPHECWLVLDATTGQNALSQAKIFGEAVPLTGVVLAKLDSTAKGGVVVAIAEQLKLPVRFVGVGENLEDLRPFDPREFVEALFAEDDSRPEASSGSYAA